MKKVAFVTLHRVFNYGSVLQTYATQKILEEIGCEVEVIDYITEQRTLKRYFSNKTKYYAKGIKGALLQLLKNVSVLIKYKQFNQFLKKYVKLSPKKYVTNEDIKQDMPSADVYMVGSDQVWNSKYNEGIDKGFFLDFADGYKKIAFCSSFGLSALPENEVDETKGYLENFDKISVRENQSNAIFERLGMGKKAVLIDPTLQIDKMHWDNMASKRLVKKPYLLEFALYNEDEKVTKIAREIADKKGLRIVKLSWDLFKDKRVDKLFTHRTPSDFLSLFKYADYIVTNSFHGLAFSLIFERQFSSVERNEFNERISNLLKVVDLERRLIKNEIDFGVVNEPIDYEKIKVVINEEGNKAREYLISALED